MLTSASSSPLDDKTVAYVLETERAFGDLRQVLSQLAGLLVLEASGSKVGGPDHPMLALVAGTLHDAADDVRHARPTLHCRAHHQLLLDAVGDLESAVTAAQRGISCGSLDAILRPLRAAYSGLEKAAGQLPGFELVGFACGCCGASRPSSPSRRSRPSRPASQ